MDAERPLSANERIKGDSGLLRGTIAAGLDHVETGALADDDTQLTKFHGFYQQDDRDLRAERGKQRMEKAFSFMVRMRVPAGILTPAQWLKVEKLALRAGQPHDPADHAGDGAVPRHPEGQPEAADAGAA